MKRTTCMMVFAGRILPKYSPWTVACSQSFACGSLAYDLIQRLSGGFNEVAWKRLAKARREPFGNAVLMGWGCKIWQFALLAIACKSSPKVREIRTGVKRLKTFF